MTVVVRCSRAAPSIPEILTRAVDRGIRIVQNSLPKGVDVVTIIENGDDMIMRGFDVLSSAH
jgi:hypothetical protein